MNLQQANFQDLRKVYFDQTEAPEAQRLTLAALENEAVPPLHRLLRHHEDEPVTDLEEIRWRHAFDQLVRWFSVLEISLIAGFIPPPDEAEFWQRCRRVLTQADFGRYFAAQYPAPLPQLLVSRLAGATHGSQVDGSAAPQLMIEFLALDLRFNEELGEGALLFLKSGAPIRGVLLLMLDDFWIADVPFAEVEKVLSRKEEFIERLLRPEEARDDLRMVMERRSMDDFSAGEGARLRDAVIDRALHEFHLFLTFCFELRDLLGRAEAWPLLQSAFWHHYSYWFGIVGSRLQRKLGEALEQFLVWSPLGDSDQVQVLAEIQEFVRHAKATLQDLTSSRYSSPVADLANSYL